MAENLNYNASGSRCYGDNTGNDSQGNCAIYGRLYNWATAMDNSANSTANPSGVKGVCPEGWHLPSLAEWMMASVGGLYAAGKHLKARDGWSSCGPSGSGKSYSCEDTYGFSALPGGYGNSGSFYGVDFNGFWWSSSSDDNLYYTDWAYGYYMNYNEEGTDWDSPNKSVLQSVRCVKD